MWVCQGDEMATGLSIALLDNDLAMKHPSPRTRMNLPWSVFVAIGMTTRVASLYEVLASIYLSFIEAHSKELFIVRSSLKPFRKNLETPFLVVICTVICREYLKYKSRVQTSYSDLKP